MTYAWRGEGASCKWQNCYCVAINTQGMENESSSGTITREALLPGWLYTLIPFYSVPRGQSPLWLISFNANDMCYVLYSSKTMRRFGKVFLGGVSWVVHSSSCFTLFIIPFWWVLGIDPSCQSIFPNNVSIHDRIRWCVRIDPKADINFWLLVIIMQLPRPSLRIRVVMDPKHTHWLYSEID